VLDQCRIESAHARPAHRRNFSTHPGPCRRSNFQTSPES
jgi:hypothetical protein